MRIVPEYVALSYAWSQCEFMHRVTTALPKTIDDGITVTLAMGLRYLWVDRYVSRAHIRLYPLI